MTNNQSSYTDKTTKYLDMLRKEPILYSKYRHLDEHFQTLFLDFMTRSRSLPLTYDPIFKRLFNPDLYPHRLSNLISSIIGQDVTVISVLPSEESLFTNDSLLVMDIVVRLAGGALANVEIQKVPYAFAGERASCYSSDLLLRQYSRLKSEYGTNFNYSNMKKVFTIIFYEKTSLQMRVGDIGDRTTHAYIHHGEVKFDTGIRMNFLQEYWLISLDEFHKAKYTKPISRQTAWLSLLSTDSFEKLHQLCTAYPWMEELITEISEFLQKPEITRVSKT